MTVLQWLLAAIAGLGIVLAIALAKAAARGDSIVWDRGDDEENS